jgi:transcription-repair coupling factor (superfamily II helicase)
MNVKDLENKFLTSEKTSHFLRSIKSAKSVIAKNIYGGARLFIINHLFKQTGQTVLCIAPNEEEGKGLFDDLKSFAFDDVEFFPMLGRQTWGETGPLASVVGRRLYTIQSLLAKKKIIVTSSQALLEKTAHPETIRQNLLRLTPGTTIYFDNFIQQLVRMGYVREDQVDRPGEMSVRGGIVDIFPLDFILPVRIEFWGDQIESIRNFNVENQRSIQPCAEIFIIPLSAGGPYCAYDEHPVGTLSFQSTILDFLPSNSIIVLFDQVVVFRELENYQHEISIRLETFSKDHHTFSLDYPNFYTGFQALEKRLLSFINVNFSIFPVDSTNESIDFKTNKNNNFLSNLQLFKKELEFHSVNNALFLLCESDSQTNRMRDLLWQEGFPNSLEIETLNISEGFQWPEQGLYVYTNRELYGRKKIPKPDITENRLISLNFLISLKRGDYVVHTDYGIGLFQGLQRIAALGKERECILIEYQNHEQLFVPLEKMDRIQKYSSRDGVTPHLSRLGTKRWEATKQNAKKRIKEIAQQLIKLYAIRKMTEGYSFLKDNTLQKELEASFQYEETMDQLTAIDDIKRDMESSKSMDRLVCGDVGYGKTEVAIRAAFKAINNDKQVAVLVPTTILAQQHFTTFRNRLALFPVNIEVLSRFKTPSEQKQIVNGLATGEIDLVIGTHRLVSDDVKFKNLGLLIIDEEQKFGVVHKEKLKILKATVDTLTLSATPIPRTMHMALIGARDLSLINTPPHNRLPIKTEVCRFDIEFIREIILKEIGRGGQVFFVHNRVETIYGIASMLKESIPEVTISVAHGKMDAADLEKIMFSFSAGSIQCLVCTMIIESGIDLPNVNTLIVNRADKFGLSQLYQLRGRVGRSDHQAYAYLLIPPVKKLTRNAIKRLQTIQEMAHLGSGYKIAMRDLEIRGAGNVFGAQQSGYVDALGYELYIKIIEEAIQELRNEMNMDTKPTTKEEEFETRIEMNVDAFLPESYVISATERVDIYRRLIEAKDIQTLNQLLDELIDRFGPAPIPVLNLFNYIAIKILAKKAKLSNIFLNERKLIGQFAVDYIPVGEHFRPWLGKMLQKVDKEIELRQEKNNLYFEIKFGPKEDLMEATKNFLQTII